MWRYAACRLPSAWKKRLQLLTNQGILGLVPQQNQVWKKRLSQIKTDFHSALCGCCRRCRSWAFSRSINQWFNMCKATCFYPPRSFFQKSQVYESPYCSHSPGSGQDEGPVLLICIELKTSWKTPSAKEIEGQFCDFNIYIYNIYFQLFHVWLMESRNHHLRLVRRWRWMMWDSPGEVAKWITYNFITFMTFDDRSARVVSCLQCRSVRYTDFQTCQNWPIAWLLRELPDIPAEFLQKLQVLVAQRRLQSTEAELETAFCGDLKQLKKEGDFLGQVMEPRHWANLGSSASCCWGDVL